VELRSNLAATNSTESWNGTSWTEVNDLNTARYDLAGAGTDKLQLWHLVEQEPGKQFAATEEWNVGPQTITFSDS
jgi:hypothetical protein